MLFVNNNGDAKKLIYKLSSHECVNLLELNMIKSNVPKNFINIEYSYENRRLEYKIDGYISIREYKKVFGREEVVELLQAIVEAINQIPEYMLREENLILKPEYIYLKASSSNLSNKNDGKKNKKNKTKIYESIKFIYLPINKNLETLFEGDSKSSNYSESDKQSKIGKNYSLSGDIAVEEDYECRFNLDAVREKSLNNKLINILSSLVFDSSENTSYVVKILNYLNGNRNFNTYEFLSVLKEILKDEWFINAEKGFTNAEKERRTARETDIEQQKNSKNDFQTENLFDSISFSDEEENSFNNEREISFEKEKEIKDKRVRDREVKDKEYKNMFSVEEVSEEFNTENLFKNISFRNTFFKNAGKNKSKNGSKNGIEKKDIKKKGMERNGINKIKDEKTVLNEDKKRKKLNIISNNEKAKKNPQGEITLWYLLNHFSKENLNKYRNQRN